MTLLYNRQNPSSRRAAFWVNQLASNGNGKTGQLAINLKKANEEKKQEKQTEFFPSSRAHARFGSYLHSKQRMRSFAL